LWASNLLGDPIDLLSNPTDLFTGFAWLLLGLLCIVELVSYFKWRSKAKVVAEHGEFLKVPDTSKFQKAVLIITIGGAVIWAINYIIYGDNLRRWIAILMCIYMPALFVIVNATKEFLKRKKASRGVNRTVTMFTSFIVAFAMMGAITFGTLYVSNHGFFADKNEETYEYRGLTWVIHQDELPLVVEDLMDVDFDGYITLNGQYCFASDGTVIYENTIARNDLEILVDELEKNPFPAGFVMRDTKVFNYRDERVDAIHEITHNDNHPAGDVSKVLDEKIYQVMCFIDEAKEKELLSRMHNCTAARWHPLFCDISPLGGTKVKGIDNFLKYHGIDLSETMAFGDGGNDLQMLEHTAVSVAMGNAPENVKEVSTYVTDSCDDDGLVKALAHFGLLEP
jgi:Cof subfamily protein (haloacid dehalogenase superfamily)